MLPIGEAHEADSPRHKSQVKAKDPNGEPLALLVAGARGAGVGRDPPGSGPVILVARRVLQRVLGRIQRT